MYATETPIEPTCCLKCRRILRRPSPDGYGPKCRAKVRKTSRSPLVDQYKPHLVEAAVELLEQGGLIPLRKNRIFFAASSDGLTTYKTHRAGCTCPAGIKGVHVCKHRIAAHIVSAA